MPKKVWLTTVCVAEFRSVDLDPFTCVVYRDQRGRHRCMHEDEFRDKTGITTATIPRYFEVEVETSQEASEGELLTHLLLQKGIL